MFWKAHGFQDTKNVTYAYVGQKHKDFRLLSCHPQHIGAVILSIPIAELPPQYQALYFDPTEIEPAQYVGSFLGLSRIEEAGPPWLSL
jgi:hypothetical protein